MPDGEQASALLATMRKANAACNRISEIAWEKKVFNQFKLHAASYREIKNTGLSAQVVVRCISKVADAYKLDHRSQRIFKPLGAITYDERILSYAKDKISLWSIEGRLKISFVCHRPDWLPFVKGEADLITRKGKFFLFQTAEIPEENIKDVEEFLGVDFGLRHIATLSTGEKMSGKDLENYRIKRQRVRSSLQSKCTTNARKVLKRLSGKERTTARIVNHTIAKTIVEKAKAENKGIALENLKGIRERSLKKGRVFRSRVGRWNFSFLRQAIEYKARLAGIPVVLVNPRHTSQRCFRCGNLGSRKGESFKCACGFIEHADVNAARNIAFLALPVNQGEKSAMCPVLSHG